jgi:excisionase family DNA binding protein
MTVKRAAQALGVSAEHVRALVRGGRLVGTKEGRAMGVTVDSVRTFLEEREAAAVARRRVIHDHLDILAAVWHVPRDGAVCTR